MTLILFWFLLGANKLSLRWPFLNNGYKRRRHPTICFSPKLQSINEKDSYLGVYSFPEQPFSWWKFLHKQTAICLFNLELAVKLPIVAPNNMTGTFEGTAGFNSYHVSMSVNVWESQSPVIFRQGASIRNWRSSSKSSTQRPCKSDNKSSTKRSHIPPFQVPRS